MTKEQAVKAGYRDEIHYGECKKVVGIRGGVTIKQTRVRVNGKCQTWKTRPSDFRLPYAYGLYDHGYIDQNNCESFHIASECPLLDQE